MRAGKPLSISLPLRNEGNSNASGTISVGVRLGDSQAPIATAQAKVNLKPGAAGVARIKLPLNLPAGTYALQASLDTSAVSPSLVNASDNR